MPFSPHYKPDPRWPQLGTHFYDVVAPAQFPSAILRFRNDNWDHRIGLDTLDKHEWKNHFWSFQPLPQNMPAPLALRYHGHQFTHYNDQLGDGRGFLLAQLRDSNNRLLDLGTKGSGTTPWSRRGDGRLTLKGAVREMIATEMLEALGVNTSKTLSVYETGESLERNDEPSPTRSAVLVRLSHGHVRIGTFQRQAYLANSEALQQLLYFSCENYYPQIDREQPIAKLIADFFANVAQQMALTTAQWMVHGFVHGVLNTDNINISGESFDYGPYRFLPYYDPQFTAAYFDHSGLYAYGQQPQMMFWNLKQLQTSLQLISPIETDFKKGLALFQSAFSQSVVRLFFQKLNLQPSEDEETDLQFFSSTLKFLETTKMPYDAFFRDWSCGVDCENIALESESASFYKTSHFNDLKQLMKHFIPQKTPHHHTTSCFRFPVIEVIESLWSSIERDDDWTELNQYIQQIRQLRTDWD